MSWRFFFGVVCFLISGRRLPNANDMCFRCGETGPDIESPRAEVWTCDVQSPSRISQGPHVLGEVKTVLVNEMTERLHDENSKDYDDVLQVDSHLLSSLVEYGNNE